MIKVVVLGCGPAGLLAAHAATLLGADVKIYSKPEKSQIFGAQFIHRAIPEIKVPSRRIQFLKTGTGDVYAEKVYGDRLEPTSWDKYEEGDHAGWSMRAVYDILWARYEHLIVPQVLDSDVLGWIEQYDDADCLITSIPAPVLCMSPDGASEHTFMSVPMAVVSDWPWPLDETDTVVYNGETKDAWCRASCFDGHSSVEYGQIVPAGLKGPIRRGFKPMWTDCDCRPQWLRVGRFGKWKRGTLSHTAFEEAHDALHILFR
jgi:hypothetical protein